MAALHGPAGPLMTGEHLRHDRLLVAHEHQVNNMMQYSKFEDTNVKQSRQELTIKDSIVRNLKLNHHTHFYTGISNICICGH